MRVRILLIARDVALRARLARLLKDAGYGVELAEDAQHARRVGVKDIALAVVAGDVLGADAPGFMAELEAKAIQTLLLDDRAGESGLLARIADATRKAPIAEASEPVLRFGAYRLDLAGHSLTDETWNEVGLTRGEFSLLREFARRPGRVLSRDQLLTRSPGATPNPTIAASTCWWCACAARSRRTRSDPS